MRIKHLLLLNVAIIAALGWWVSIHLLSREHEETHQDDIAFITNTPPQELHYDSSFPDGEPYFMAETFNTIYFEGSTDGFEME